MLCSAFFLVLSRTNLSRTNLSCPICPVRLSVPEEHQLVGADQGALVFRAVARTSDGTV